MATVEEVSARFLEIFDACFEQGMQVPFIACFASRNGSVLCVRVTGEERAADVLAERFEPGGFTMPITGMVLDQTGKVAQVTITAERMTFH